MVAAVSWTGPDAEGFRERWEQCRQELSLTADHLGSAFRSISHGRPPSRTARPTRTANRCFGLRRDAGRPSSSTGPTSSTPASGSATSGGTGSRPGTPRAPLGERYPEAHPGWDPSDVGTDQDAIENSLVNQGSLGDCWYLAALMAVQQTDPGLLAENISGLGEPPGMDGWEVRLQHRRRVALRPLSPRGSRHPRHHRRRDRGTQLGHDLRDGDDQRERWPPLGRLGGRTGRRARDDHRGNPHRNRTRSHRPSFEEYKEAIDDGRPSPWTDGPAEPHRSRQR